MNFNELKNVKLDNFDPMSKEELSKVVGGIQASQVFAMSSQSYRSGYYSSGSGCDGTVVCCVSCGSAAAQQPGATPIMELPVGQTIMLEDFGGLHRMEQGGELVPIPSGS